MMRYIMFLFPLVLLALPGCDGKVCEKYNETLVIKRDANGVYTSQEDVQCVDD